MEPSQPPADISQIQKGLDTSPTQKGHPKDETSSVNSPQNPETYSAWAASWENPFAQPTPTALANAQDQPSTGEATHRFHRARIFCLLIVAFYSVCALIGLIMIWIQQGVPLPFSYIHGKIPILYQLGIGLVFGILVILASIGGHRFRMVQNTEQHLRGMIGYLKIKHIVCVALYSALGEELLFRGGLQPWLGLWITSILFGILHWPSNKNMIFYPFFAMAAGFSFGWMFEYTGGLLAPILAHCIINAVNLYRIVHMRPVYS